MNGRLQVRLLGEITVLRDSQELSLPPSKKTRALLAYLVLTGRRQRRDDLCRIFWETPDDPRAALRWSLSKLRQIIEQDHNSDHLKTDRDTVFFDASEINLDVRDVARLAAKCWASNPATSRRVRIAAGC